MRAIIKILILFIISSVSLFSQETPKLNLHLATLQGNIDAIKEHIQFGTNLDEKDQFGSTPLIIAATFGKTEAAKVLIDAGADLSTTNNEGSAPLHVAAFFCNKDIVEALVENGADKFQRNNDGSTAYDIAAAPVELDLELYKRLKVALAPIGLVIDLDKIRNVRPTLTEILKPISDQSENLNYEPQKSDEWKISNPEEQGIEQELVSDLYGDAEHLETLYSLLLIKNGFLIGEKYFNEGSIGQLSKRASVTKSFTSALMGIAIDKGIIESVDEKKINFFPELTNKITDERKNEITIKQMLQMRAGYPWEETDTLYWNTLWTGKYLNVIEEFPLKSDPGTLFQYSNLTSNWLSIIISRAAKTDLRSFGEEHLFAPLNIKIGDWNRDFDGYYIGSGDIELFARDMAKFGLLYLNDGKYNDEQIISSKWVKDSFQKYSHEINSAGVKSSKVGRYFHDLSYGYQWWFAKVGNYEFNFAWGHGGQLIVLIDDLDMVIVTTADCFYGKENHWNAWKHEKSIINLVGKFINSLPAKA